MSILRPLPCFKCKACMSPVPIADSNFSLSVSFKMNNSTIFIHSHNYTFQARIALSSNVQNTQNQANPESLNATLTNTQPSTNIEDFSTDKNIDFEDIKNDDDFNQDTNLSDSDRGDDNPPQNPTENVKNEDPDFPEVKVKMDIDEEMYEVIGTKVGTLRFKCSVCNHKSRYKQGVIGNS